MDQLSKYAAWSGGSDISVKGGRFCYSFRMAAAARILINLLENLFLLSAQLSTPLLPSLYVIIQFSINKLTRSKRKAQRMKSIKDEWWVAMLDMFLLFCWRLYNAKLLK